IHSVDKLLQLRRRIVVHGDPPFTNPHVTSSPENCKKNKKTLTRIPSRMRPSKLYGVLSTAAAANALSTLRVPSPSTRSVRPAPLSEISKKTVQGVGSRRDLSIPL